jgi:hypothetical protein
MSEIERTIETIKRLYYEATAGTIDRDFDRAVDLLKTLPDEETRERVAVYMDGLAQMRREFGSGGGGREFEGRKKKEGRRKKDS